MQNKSKESAGTRYGIEILNKAVGKTPSLARGRAKYLTLAGMKIRITEASYNQRGKNWCFSLGEEHDNAVLAIGAGDDMDKVPITAWLIPRQAIDATGSFFIKPDDPRYSKYIIPLDINQIDPVVIRAALGYDSSLSSGRASGSLGFTWSCN